MIEIKNHTWKIYGGEEEFKEDFPLSSNRSTIYQMVKNGRSVMAAVRHVNETLSFHEKAQKTKKMRYGHTARA